METLKCIKTRRSYRKFLQKPIEEENEAVSEPIVPEHTEQQPDPAVSKQIPPKGVTKLTPEERNALIEEAKRGIENEFYKVSFCLRRRNEGSKTSSIKLVSARTVQRRSRNENSPNNRSQRN